MAQFDIHTASTYELKKKIKFNKNMFAFFIGIFLVLLVVNVFNFFIHKKINFSSASFLIFIVLGFGMHKSTNQMEVEIKKREQIIN